MPRGGHNKLPIEHHIATGNYRPSRHGVMAAAAKTDKESLNELKTALYNRFKELEKKLRKLELSKDIDEYKKISDIQIALAKAFHAIVKAPPIEEQQEHADADGFK